MSNSHLAPQWLLTYFIYYQEANISWYYDFIFIGGARSWPDRWSLVGAWLTTLIIIMFTGLISDQVHSLCIYQLMTLVYTSYVIIVYRHCYYYETIKRTFFMCWHFESFLQLLFFKKPIVEDELNCSIWVIVFNYCLQIYCFRYKMNSLQIEWNAELNFIYEIRVKFPYRVHEGALAIQSCLIISLHHAIHIRSLSDKTLPNSWAIL